MNCKSGIRFFRKHSCEFGINPDELIVFGESAGAHLAVCLGLIEQFNHPEDDLFVSCSPNLIVNCNGIEDLTGKWKDSICDKRLFNDNEIKKLALDLSPYYNISYNQPEIIMFHGENDTTVPISESEKFMNKYNRYKNKATLIPIKNAKHSFILFNYTADNEDVLNVIKQIEVYLKEHCFK